MSFRPMLIKEPDIRWPIVLLAALITTAIALLVTVMHFVASTKAPVVRSSPPSFEWMLQPGQPDFDHLRQQITIEQLMGNEKLHPFNDLAVELTAVVRNETGRTISGLEMRGAILDTADSTLRERTVAVIPVQQAILEINEAINVRILLEGFDRDSDRAHTVLEVTGITFE
ncbi:MAG TPA: hypothetical protein VFT02_03895 [Pyrinomonadaceae bacterium]|nr:hypothetical protein [Pyrinomonadaceae bacterium]